MVQIQKFCHIFQASALYIITNNEWSCIFPVWSLISLNLKHQEKHETYNFKSWSRYSFSLNAFSLSEDLFIIPMDIKCTALVAVCKVFKKFYYKNMIITLRHVCSPVNLLHIFRTSFSKNTSRWLLLISLKAANRMFVRLVLRCLLLYLFINLLAILFAFLTGKTTLKVFTLK